MHWPSSLSAFLALLLFVVVPAAVAAAAHAAFRRVVPQDRLLPHHDVAGFLVSVVGVLYAVVLGFVVVTSWSTFDSAQQNADIEAGAVADAYSFAHLLPEPRRSDLRKYLKAYALEVRDYEWEAMRHGGQDLCAHTLLISAEESLGERVFRNSASLDEALNRQTTRQTVAASLRDVADSRRLRLLQTDKGLTPTLDFALLLGAIMVLAFVFMFGVVDVTLQLTMTALVAGCIGLLIGVVVQFSQPFAGPLRVSPSAWTNVIEHMHATEAINACRPVTAHFPQDPA